jgi:uncharacterized protein (DUF2344 family)
MIQEKILREVMEEAYIELVQQMELRDASMMKLLDQIKVLRGEKKELEKTITKLQKEIVKKDALLSRKSE